MRPTERFPLVENSGLTNRSVRKRDEKGKTKMYGKRTKPSQDSSLIAAFSNLQISSQEPQVTSEKTSFLREPSKAEDSSRPVPEYLQPLTDKCKASFLTFDEFASRCLRQLDVTKLGEGSYGDVYGVHRPNTELSDPDTVLKIVPLRPPTGQGSRKHTSVENLVSEYMISALMDEFPGFLRMRTIFLVDGHYPPSLYQAYLDYKKNSRTCHNPDPTDSKNYPKNQAWAILEMEYAGVELEKLHDPTLHQIFDIFWTVAFSLGRAEEQVQFEHRDLHLSNICYRIQKSPAKRFDRAPLTPTSSDSHGSDDDQAFFGTSDIRITIIDFTLSRATLEDGTVVFEDLERMAFEKRTAQNEDESRQNKAYARMAETACSVGKGQSKKQKWKAFNQGSNVAWLSYLLSSLLARSGKHKPEKNEAVLAKRLSDLSNYLKDITTLDQGFGSGISCLIHIALAKKFLSKGDVNAVIERLNSG